MLFAGRIAKIPRVVTLPCREPLPLSSPIQSGTLKTGSLDHQATTEALHVWIQAVVLKNRNKPFFAILS